MRVELNSLELVEREAAAAKHGAEAMLRALRAELRDARRAALTESGEHDEKGSLERAVLRAGERALGRFERELSDASDRFSRAPTERNLEPVKLEHDGNGYGRALRLVRGEAVSP